MLAGVSASVERVQLRILKNQVKSLPEELVEQARLNFLMNEDIKQRDLQNFQMSMIGKLELILRKQLTKDGIDFRTFRIGGYDRGVYERFFRIEPARYMSRAQFVTALYRCFGQELNKKEKSLYKLYDSFDPTMSGEMDWRSFLLLVILAMQPDLPVKVFFKYFIMIIMIINDYYDYYYYCYYDSYIIF